MAKTWEKWFDEVLTDVAGCPQPVAKNAIRNAAIDFCERSLVYRVSHDPINAVQDQPSYAYAPPAGFKVVRPMTVWYDGNQITAKTQAELEDLYVDWMTESGTPLFYLAENPDALILVPMPSAALVGGITLKVALKPSRAAADIDDWVWEKYLEPIACGAKARLFAMKKKPWSDAARATYYATKFTQDIATAMHQANRGFVGARRRVRAHFL